MNLNIDTRELGMLVEIVESQLSDLRQQVRRAETPRFHDELKVDEALLRDLLAKLRLANDSAAA